MVFTGRIGVRTQGMGDIIDISPQVRREVASSGVQNGAAIVFVSGSTAGLTTIEYEPGLVHDLQVAWERLAPVNIPYQHDARWGDGNGFSHVRAALQGASLSIPVIEGSLALGAWQQIVLIDFDNRPRGREIVVQVMGD